MGYPKRSASSSHISPNTLNISNYVVSDGSSAVIVAGETPSSGQVSINDIEIVPISSTVKNIYINCYSYDDDMFQLRFTELIIPNGYRLIFSMGSSGDNEADTAVGTLVARDENSPDDTIVVNRNDSIDGRTNLDIMLTISKG